MSPLICKEKPLIWNFTFFFFRSEVKTKMFLYGWIFWGQNHLVTMEEVAVDCVYILLHGYFIG